MGLDLTLLPFDHDSQDLAFAHSVLDCERRSDLFQEIMDLPYQERVPARFTSYLSRDEKYEEPHYGSTTETPY